MKRLTQEGIANRWRGEEAAVSASPGHLARCANCGLEIEWEPVVVEGVPYCCGGCALGGPCCCSYDLPEAAQIGPQTDPWPLAADVRLPLRRGER